MKAFGGLKAINKVDFELVLSKKALSEPSKLP